MGFQFREEGENGWISILLICIDAWNVVTMSSRVLAALASSTLRDRGLDGTEMESGWGPSLVPFPSWNLAYSTFVRWRGLRGIMGGRKVFIFRYDCIK